MKESKNDLDYLLSQERIENQIADRKFCILPEGYPVTANAIYWCQETYKPIKIQLGLIITRYPLEIDEITFLAPISDEENIQAEKATASLSSYKLRMIKAQMKDIQLQMDTEQSDSPRRRKLRAERDRLLRDNYFPEQARLAENFIKDYYPKDPKALFIEFIEKMGDGDNIEFGLVKVEISFSLAKS